MERVTAVLIRFDLKYKVKSESLQIKVGGYDRRKEKFIGSIQMEHFAWEGGEGSRCVMNRQTVSIRLCLFFNHDLRQLACRETPWNGDDCGKR